MALAITLAGCQTPAKNVPARKPGHGSDLGKPTGPSPLLGNTDPSAMKLHDISGGLLMYYAVHHQLPDSFAQLQEVADMADGPIDAGIPGTTQQYVYTRDGIYLQDLEEWVVVYEPAPMHGGQRAVIVINQPHDNEVLQTKVVTVPEQFFLLHPPTPAPAKPAGAPGAVPPPGSPPSPAAAGPGPGKFGNRP